MYSVDDVGGAVNTVYPWGIISAGQLGIGNPGTYGGENVGKSMYDEGGFAVVLYNPSRYTSLTVKSALADTNAKEFRRWLFRPNYEGAKAFARYSTGGIAPIFNQPMAHPINWEKVGIYAFYYWIPATIYEKTTGDKVIPKNHKGGARPWGHDLFKRQH